MLLGLLAGNKLLDLSGRYSDHQWQGISTALRYLGVGVFSFTVLLWWATGFWQTWGWPL
jgi:hypothetical protein